MTKNIFIRTISLFLMLAMLIPAIACAENQSDEQTATSPDESGTAAEEETTKEPAPVEQKNYNATYNTLYCNDIYDIDYYFAEKETGVRVSDLTYERSLYIKDYLGVTLTTTNGGTWTEYFSFLKNSVKSGDDLYQMVMTHPHGSIADMIVGNYLLDFKEIPGINLDKEYWHKSLMDEVSIKDALYLGYSDFSLASCNVIAYNKRIYTNHNFENPYTLVDNKEWTLEKFLSIASEISVDVTQNGKTVDDDTFGLAGWGWVQVVSFMTGCDIKVCDKNSDGEAYISLNTDYGEKFSGLCDTFKEVFDADYSFLWPCDPVETIDITTDRVLFHIVNNASLIEFLDSQVSVGILPYPLYDINQKQYKTLSWNGYLVIPSSIQNIEMVGDTTEMLMYLSDDVKTAYFEVLLGSRIADAPEDARMLDIIWDSQVSDIGLAYCSTSQQLEYLFYALARVGGSNQSYSSFYKTNEKAAAKKLAKLFQ